MVAVSTLPKQLGIYVKKQKTPESFSKKIAEGIKLANKLVDDLTKPRGRPKRQSLEPIRHGRKKLTIAMACKDIRFDQLGHWLIPVNDKKQCRVCQSYSRMACEK